jgi:hypothetical protein
LADDVTLPARSKAPGELESGIAKAVVVPIQVGEELVGLGWFGMVGLTDEAFLTSDNVLGELR